MRLSRLLKRDLARETSIWVDKGVISLDQAKSICQLYGLDYDSERDRSTGYRLLNTLGFLFIGLASITVIGANWQSIPSDLRIAGCIALTLATHGVATWQFTAGRNSLAAGLFLLGNLFYGACIILIAQIYHLGETMTDGVYWWALGSLPFAVLLCNPWLALFFSLLALIWLPLQLAAGSFALTFPVFLAAQVYVLFRGQMSVALFLTLFASVVLWVNGLFFRMWQDASTVIAVKEAFFVNVALFVLACALGQWLSTRDDTKWKDYGVIMSLWNLRFGLICMLVLGYEAPWTVLLESDWINQASVQASTVSVVAVALISAIWFGTMAGRLQAFLAASVLYLAVMATTALASVPEATPFAVVDNFALVGIGVWLILRGSRIGSSHYFFLGVTAILLTAFTRYIDLIGDYVGAAVLFAFLALLLLGSARYWRLAQRKEVGT